jgi:MFS family permease
MTATLEDKVGRKVLWRLVLPCALFILLGAVDRTNVGFAALQMNAALGFSGAQFGFGAGILFMGYVAANYPSVLLYERIGMRHWLALITFVWAVAAMAMAFIADALQFYALRVVIGLAEGGLASGIMLYLSHWASERYRASVLAIPIGAIFIAQIVSAPVSGWLLQVRNPLGLEGWRWMFLVEGFPALILAVFAWLHFPSAPDDARWLSTDERTWLAANVNGAARPVQGQRDRWRALANPITWVSSGIWFGLLAGNYGVMFWLPQVVRGMAGLTPVEVGFVVSLPWLGAAAALVLNARHSDRRQERFLHIAVPSAVAAVALLGAYGAGGGLLGLLALVVGGACLGSTVAPFWAIPTKLLPPRSVATGIVAINIIGSMAGVTVPGIMGLLTDRSGSYLPATALLSGLIVAASFLCLLGRSLQHRIDRAPRAGS